MRAALSGLIALCCCTLGLLPLAFVSAADSAPPVDFEAQIAPLLIRRCSSCHNPSEAAGGLNLLAAAPALAGGDSGEPAIVAGDPAHSHLLERITAGEMPPPGKGQPVTAEERDRLARWITAGAHWPQNRVLSPFEFTSDTRAGRDWWSLAPPRTPHVPTVRHADRVRNPIDDFVLARLEEAGIEPSDDAQRATFIRRAMLDLLGLPPTQQEIEQFAADDAPDAYEKLIDRLLASPRYGERWARHWLDVVRFGESNGYETNLARPNAWPYRDWVIAALNEDLSYPRFIFEQLAGDQTGVDAATGFLVGGTHDAVGSPDIELTLTQRMNDLADMISTTATAFLGLTVGCAKCHDHKFDPVSQRDYYALQAIFAGVQHGQRELRTSDSTERKRQADRLRTDLAELDRKIQELSALHQPLAALGGSSAPVRPSVNAALNVDRFAPISARFVRFTVLATSQIEPCIDELEVLSAGDSARNLALASAGAKATSSSVFADGSNSLHKLEHVNDGRYGNGRSWISAESGAGWVQIELAEPAVIDRVLWARDREKKFKDRLATRYKIEVGEDGHSWREVANSDDRQNYDANNSVAQSPTAGLPVNVAEQIQAWTTAAAALRAQIDQLQPAQVYAGTFSQPEATHLLYRGEPLQKRDEVSPGAIATVSPTLGLASNAPEHERRIALARWLGSPANPLTARVMVNRVWHYHFGQGLVKTPGDLGFNGGVPSHPELLDWLATEFVEHGWSIKYLHRTIMLSGTYRQSSRTNPQAVAKDATNRLLWRFAPRRLEAEPIRDVMLWTSGALDLRMGGPGYDVFESNGNYVKVYTPKARFGPAEWRRMVYQEKPRMQQDATFGEFDCPDASQTMSRRNVSTTALQALNLLHGPFVIQQAGLLAQRLEREVGSDTDAQIRRAFWLAFGRAVDDEELSAARRLVSEQGLLVFCRAIYNANEFLYLN